jgi:hypothetical protein
MLVGALVAYRRAGHGRPDPVLEPLRPPGREVGHRLDAVDPRRARRLDWRAGRPWPRFWAMPASQENTGARATAGPTAPVLEVELGGPWRLSGETPRWSSVLGDAKPSGVRLAADGVSHWDTSLVVFLGEAQRWCAAAGRRLRHGAPPAGEDAPPLRAVRGLDADRGHDEHSQSLVVEVGLSTRSAGRQVRDFLSSSGNAGSTRRGSSRAGRACAGATA